MKIDLVKNPEHIYRLGKTRAALCRDCQRVYTWHERCRKCQRIETRRVKKVAAKWAIKHAHEK